MIEFGVYECGCKVIKVDDKDYVIRDCRSDTYEDIDGIVPATKNQFKGKAYTGTDDFEEFLSDLDGMIQDAHKFREIKFNLGL